jgi:hypothetical protein
MITQDTTEGNTALKIHQSSTHAVQEKEIMLHNLGLNNEIRKKVFRQYIKCSSFARILK